MAAYYPRRVARFADLQKAYPGFETYDDFEEDRIESVAITKSRGKGAPKKKRTAAGKWRLRKREGKRMKKDGKDGMLTRCEIQNPRSLARRRGKGCTEGGFLCLESYSTRTKAKAGACKNTHGCMGCKSKKDKALGSHEERRSMEFYLEDIRRWRSSPCTKISTFNHHTKSTNRVLYSIGFAELLGICPLFVFCPTQQDRISLTRRISKDTRMKNISVVYKNSLSRDTWLSAYACSNEVQ